MCSPANAATCILLRFAERFGESGANRQQSDRAVHGAGIEVGNLETVCEKARHRTLPGAGGAIDRNDQRFGWFRGLTQGHAEWLSSMTHRDRHCTSVPLRVQPLMPETRERSRSQQSRHLSLSGSPCYGFPVGRRISHSKDVDLLGDERRRIDLPRQGRLRVGVGYPNRYHVALSSLAYQWVVELAAGVPGIALQRFFAPPDCLGRTLEDDTPLASLDLLAWSCSFELDAVNLIHTLDAAGIARRARTVLTGIRWWSSAAPWPPSIPCP